MRAGRPIVRFRERLLRGRLAARVLGRERRTAARHQGPLRPAPALRGAPRRGRRGL